MVRYIAHSPTAASPDGQPLKEHLDNVAMLSGQFAKPFGEGDGKLCGLYHDIGKYSDAAQRRVRGGSAPVDHSSAGALLMFEKRNVPVSMCIAGHHAGLADCGSRNDMSDTYMARINAAKSGRIEDFSAWKTEVKDAIPTGCTNRPGLGNYFYTKMLFSALTDADYLDTEAYFQNRPVVDKTVDFKELLSRLNRYIKPWKSPKKAINIRRCKILDSAIQHGDDTKGMFSMTVPTGGGKTVSSMAFALNHAIAHGMKRIIYVIPYCSIIDQTKSIFDEIFGADMVTAHYSGAENTNAAAGSKFAFAVENWEAPVILTTAVQFFESLYSNTPGKNRKLHNIAESVIIFDEVQMLPVPYLRPCLAGICHLVEHYGCTAVLCTATMPAVEPMINSFLPGYPVCELCPEKDAMYKAFRRATYVQEGTLSNDELAKRLCKRKQVLCVVNTRRQAQEVYDKIKHFEGSFHLSTMMTAHDRKRILAIIIKRLRDKQVCRVVSTSLIEAGVNIDFPTVYRELAGLDSIIQSGGRCNREGHRRKNKSVVHIFRTDERPPLSIRQNISATERTMKTFTDIDSPEAVHAYFQFLFGTLKGNAALDEFNIIAKAEQLKFQTVSDDFHIIDSSDYVVYIEEGGSPALLKQLRSFGPSRQLMQRLGQYSVNATEKMFKILQSQNALEMISDKIAILTKKDLYSDEVGFSCNLL